MIDFLDSCSWCSTSVPFGLGNGPAVKYDTTSIFSGARQAGNVGPEGQGMYTFFDCIVQMQRVLTAQNRRRHSWTIFVNGYQAEANVWSWSSATGCVCSVTLGSDGKLRIYANGDGFQTLGSLLYVSQVAIPPGSFRFIDIDWDFPASGNGSCSLYIDNVLDTANPGFPSVQNFGWSGVPDRFAVVGINSGAGGTGYSICDILTSNGSGAKNNTRLGPSRVKLYPMAADAFIQWGSPNPATLPRAVNAINELPPSTAPDGDATTIQPAILNTEDLFSLGNVDCYAEVLGVALSACARGTGASLELIARPAPSNGIDVDLGSVSLQTAYGVAQAISETNLASGSGPWLDGAIANAWWGVRATAGAPVVTQIVLEKATTRSGAAFQCGQLGSYCF